MNRVVAGSRPASVVAASVGSMLEMNRHSRPSLAVGRQRLVGHHRAEVGAADPAQERGRSLSTVGESEPKALQRFLNLSPWDVNRLLELTCWNTWHRRRRFSWQIRRFREEGTSRSECRGNIPGRWGGSSQIATFLAYVTRDAIGYSWTAAYICPRIPGLADSARRRGRILPTPLSRQGRSRSSRRTRMLPALPACRSPGSPRMEQIRSENPALCARPSELTYQLCDGGTEEHDTITGRKSDSNTSR